MTSFISTKYQVDESADMYVQREGQGEFADLKHTKETVIFKVSPAISVIPIHIPCLSHTHVMELLGLSESACALQREETYI